MKLSYAKDNCIHKKEAADQLSRNWEIECRHSAHRGTDTHSVSVKLLLPLAHALLFHVGHF